MLRFLVTLFAILAATPAAYADARKDCLDLSGEIAVQNCNAALKAASNDVKLLMARGYEYNHLKDYDRGLADYTKASQLEPNNADAYHGRGYSYAGKNQYDLAIAEYNKTIRLKPNNYVAYTDRGIAYFYKGQYERAIQDYDAALKIKPDYDNATKNRAAAIAKKK